MSAYETKVALWFIPHHAGAIMYFPDIPLLKDLVILDPQVAYDDSVTFLILSAMSVDDVGQANAEKFRKTGQFQLKDLVAATGQQYHVIVISRLSSLAEHELHEECVALKKEIAAVLEQVSSQMINYGFFLNYQFAFECPSHPEREHLCVVDGTLENVKVMKCLKIRNI